MARSRSQLQTLLEETLGSDEVHYQRPENLQMNYPAFIYSREYGVKTHADNVPYFGAKQYQVIAILEDPDDPAADRLEALPYVSFEREYPGNDLLHKVFNIYF